MPLHRFRGPHLPRRSGFTLLELLLVLTVMGIMAAVVVPNLASSLGGSRVSTAARSVSALGRSARYLAMMNQVPVDLVIDLGNAKVSTEAVLNAGPGASSEAIDRIFGASPSGGAGFGYALPQSENRFDAKHLDDTLPSTFPRDILSRADDAGSTNATDGVRSASAATVADAIRQERKFADVVISFGGYQDSFGSSTDADEGVVRVRYHTNGSCRPHRILLRDSDAEEGSDDVYIVDVDSVGLPEILHGPDARRSRTR